MPDFTGNHSLFFPLVDVGDHFPFQKPPQAFLKYAVVFGKPTSGHDAFSLSISETLLHRCSYQTGFFSIRVISAKCREVRHPPKGFLFVSEEVIKVKGPGRRARKHRVNREGPYETEGKSGLLPFACKS
jgi:hypothetical protein